jgi:2-amino-4-hydroxy-6-hydroxymethyldihydropteridine diphosphokinase
VRAFIGLGGNLGEPVAAFRSAAAELRSIGPIRASSLYNSKPRDRGNQPAFTNAAIELETELEPPELLAMLKRLELALGRDPAGKRWGPRVIDLDILAFDGRCVTDPDHDLIVPHPRLHERRFPLEPVVELDPRLRPWNGAGCADLRIDVTVADLLATVSSQEVQRIGGPEWADPPSMGRAGT